MKAKVRFDYLIYSVLRFALKENWREFRNMIPVFLRFFFQSDDRNRAIRIANYSDYFLTFFIPT